METAHHQGAAKVQLSQANILLCEIFIFHDGQAGGSAKSVPNLINGNGSSTSGQNGPLSIRTRYERARGAGA